MILEAITANLDTSSGKQKLGDVLDTKWRVSLLIIRGLLFRPPLVFWSLSLVSMFELFENYNCVSPKPGIKWIASLLRQPKQGNMLCFETENCSLHAVVRFNFNHYEEIALLWLAEHVSWHPREYLYPVLVNLHDKKCKQYKTESRIYMFARSFQFSKFKIHLIISRWC